MFVKVIIHEARGEIEKGEFLSEVVQQISFSVQFLVNYFGKGIMTILWIHKMTASEN